ncbi:MAG: hypothetical protein ACFFD4_39230 [Candidatus Odinarchaeota archaeon]
MANYDIEFEIYEGGCFVHQVGDKFKYPEDMGRVCPWLLDSAGKMIRVLQYGGKLPWTYKETPYEKQINVDGVTTEFVRCPDPTSKGVVIKITRTENDKEYYDDLSKVYEINMKLKKESK